jgi:hypothetical protein
MSQQTGQGGNMSDLQGLAGFGGTGIIYNLGSTGSAYGFGESVVGRNNVGLCGPPGNPGICFPPGFGCSSGFMVGARAPGGSTGFGGQGMSVGPPAGGGSGIFGAPTGANGSGVVYGQGTGAPGSYAGFGGPGISVGAPAGIPYGLSVGYGAQGSATPPSSIGAGHMGYQPGFTGMLAAPPGMPGAGHTAQGMAVPGRITHIGGGIANNMGASTGNVFGIGGATHVYKLSSYDNTFTGNGCGSGAAFNAHALNGPEPGNNHWVPAAGNFQKAGLVMGPPPPPPALRQQLQMSFAQPTYELINSHDGIYLVERQ